ncbi:MAG TPA: alpha/beta hydrolase [Sphingomonadaceae bacterium]|nr:alpha/beta hydrolase [Sphingomonadaceae bacterium]
MARLLFPLLLALLSACSPLKSFNALVPKDRGAVLVARDVAYGTDPRQALDVYAPTGTAASARLPVIVFIYGGSWQSGSKDGYGFAARALAARGFVVAVPDYRLVPAVRFPGFVEDCAAAVRWARANAARFGGDGARVVMIGHSAGAYNAAMLALDPRYLGADRAAVRGWVGLAGPYDFLPLDGPITRAAFGGAPDLPQTQPVTHASAGDPPALLLHGAKDDTVYPRNSQALAARLRAAGGRAEVKLYPKLGHVGIVTALAAPFRGRAPVLEDAAGFARAVTAEEQPATRGR